MEEVWKNVTIVGFEELYEVSNIGRVRRAANACGTRKGRMLNPSPDADGHLRITLNSPHLSKSTFVHTLVLLAFVGPRPEGMQACHNNGNPADNRAENLRWDTHLSNARDRVIHGRSPQGSRHPNSKLTEADIPRIFEMRANGVSTYEIGDVFGIAEASISLILRRGSWSHVEIEPSVLKAVENLYGPAAGERNHYAKMTGADVLEVYRMRKAGHTHNEIAKALGVSPANVGLILQGKIWKHLYHHFTDNNPSRETGD